MQRSAPRDTLVALLLPIVAGQLRRYHRSEADYRA